MNSKPTEFCPIVASLTPRTVADTEAFTNYVDMRAVGQALFVASLGDMANEAVTVRLYEAKDGSGTEARPLKSPAALTASASANDNKLVAVGVDARELSAGFTHVRLGVVTGGETGGAVSAVAVGLQPRYSPGTSLNLAAVVSLTE
jgi:hypothetical protein